MRTEMHPLPAPPPRTPGQAWVETPKYATAVYAEGHTSPVTPAPYAGHIASETRSDDTKPALESLRPVNPAMPLFAARISSHGPVVPYSPLTHKTSAQWAHIANCVREFEASSRAGSIRNLLRA